MQHWKLGPPLNFPSFLTSFLPPSGSPLRPDCVFGTKCASVCCFSSSCSDSLTQGSDLFALDRPGPLKSVPVGPLYGALIFEGNTPLKALSGTADGGSHNPLCITKITHKPITCYHTNSDWMHIFFSFLQLYISWKYEMFTQGWSDFRIQRQASHNNFKISECHIHANMVCVCVCAHTSSVFVFGIMSEEGPKVVRPYG